ncbi:MAG: TatD family deoxyribonuclease [Gemmatimonadetes bacterium]|nr:TatD family deoxyribonuclease [Gemmatimonadota bacterium]
MSGLAPFIDSHCHLADPAFAADRDAVLAAAWESGAVGLVLIGESLERAAECRVLAAQDTSRLRWTAGVHPHDAAGFDGVRDDERLRAAVAEGACALGECGLDYHYDHSPRVQQRKAFAAQLALAAECGRPVVVHTREAADDTASMIREAGAAGVRGVMHCFTGPMPLAECAIEAGWYISFSGVVTFKRWSDDDLLRAVPEDRLLVESDAPYLAPVPYRGKRNEPAWVARTLEKVAAARGVAVAGLGLAACENAARLFGFDSGIIPRR